MEERKEESSLEQGASIQQALGATRLSFWARVKKSFVGKKVVDEAFLDILEEALIKADIGLSTTLELIESLEKRVAQEGYLYPKELYGFLCEDLQRRLHASSQEHILLEKSSARPHVTLVVGVNGVGKTTTIGKLAARLKRCGKQVVIGAADTFRAGAYAQMAIWGERTQSLVVGGRERKDAGSVAFEAVKTGLQEGADHVLIDTAGRLHNKQPLMQELGKVKRVVSKLMPEAPHQVLLVVDGSTGQNGFEQAMRFSKVTGLTGLVVTKLDSGAKGGILLQIATALSLPIGYVGTGEQMEDLQPFSADAFIAGLLGDRFA